MPHSGQPGRNGEKQTMSVERTFSIIKPDAVAEGHAGEILAMLQQAGFKRLHNLAGGITAWSDQVDPSVPKY